MDLLAALKVMVRHWAIVLAALIVTVPIARAVGDEVEPVYEAKASLLLLSPAKTYSADGTPVEVNPFTRTGTAERVAATAVLTVTPTALWKEKMRAAGATGKYTYRLASEVIVEVIVTDQTAETALDTLSTAIRLFEEELAQRQQRAGAPRETWIYVDTLAAPEKATVLLGSRIRATAGVAVLGAAVAASSALLAEAVGIGAGRYRSRRSRRRAARASTVIGRGRRARAEAKAAPHSSRAPVDPVDPVNGDGRGDVPEAMPRPAERPPPAPSPVAQGPDVEGTTAGADLRPFPDVPAPTPGQPTEVEQKG